MKTKSKLVLGLSILSAATLAAGATSTFAWYKATVGASGTAGFTNSLTSNANVSGISATVTLTFTEVDANGVLAGQSNFAIRSTKLQQVAVSQSGSGPSYTYGTVHKYWNGAQDIEYSGEATLEDFAVYQITATISNSGQATDFIGSGKDLEMSIKVADVPTAGSNDTDRLLGWVADKDHMPANITNAEAFAAQTDQTTNTARYVSTGSEDWGTGVVIGYVAVFFHGEKPAAADYDADALTGNVYVSVADAVKIP